MAGKTDSDVVITGGGIAGFSAGTFTVRHNLDAIILSVGSSLPRRNAHLENYPEFPGGVNPRLLREMMRDQAERAGCRVHDTAVVQLNHSNGGFSIELTSGDIHSSSYAIAPTKTTTDYLHDIEGIKILDYGAEFIETDDRGRTGVEWRYAAVRLPAKPYQTIIAAGHRAEGAVPVLEDHSDGFYHDWAAPEGSFTGRWIDVPPGIDGIDEAERQGRERQSMELMREYFEILHLVNPDQHPNVR